jgi:ribonuclease-3
LEKHTNIFESNRCHLPDRGYICEKIYSEKSNPYVDISRLEGKVISYKSLVIEWCQKKKIFHYDIYEDNGIDGHVSLGKIKYRRKGNCKSQSYLKESRRKASQRTYFALQEKWTKKYHIHQNYIVFVHKLTKSSHFLLSNFNRNSIFTRYFLINMAILN